jgi:hypothetical protein
VSHLTGDYLLQTDWQATNKAGGLGRCRVARRALFAHVGTYTLCFVPALLWLADSSSAGAAVLAAAVIAVLHLAVDDGRPVQVWLERIKGCPRPFAAGLMLAVDQSMHLVTLFLVALAIA